MQNVAAEFTIGQRPSINAEFSIEENQAIDTVFQINTQMPVRGVGVIDVNLTDGAFVVTSKTYIHEQGTASDTWVIEHNLDKYPSVTLVDSAGTQFQGRVEYIDENNCIVYMNGATKGKAYLN